MFLKIIAYLTNLSHLRGIPGVSAWVGSHRWARLLAWWVFPSIFWTVIIAGLREAVLLLSNLGLHLEHDPATSMWLLVIIFLLVMITLIALCISMILWVLSVTSVLFLPGAGIRKLPLGSRISSTASTGLFTLRK